MIADSILVFISDRHRTAVDFFAKRDGFLHRTVAVSSTTGVVNFARSWILRVMPEHVHEIERMDIVTNLLPLISKNCIGGISDGAFDKVRKKSVQLRSRMTVFIPK